MFKVDDNVPLPPPYRRQNRYDFPAMQPRQSMLVPEECMRSIRAMASRAKKKDRFYVTRKVMIHECDGAGEGDPHYFETPEGGRCPECGAATFGPAEPGLRVWRVE